MGRLFDFADDEEDWFDNQPYMRSGRSGAFSPLQLPNLRIWIEADKITGLTNGDPITTAQDQSGLGNNFTQSVVANKPAWITGVLNGLPVARFTHAVPTDGHWMTSPYSPANETAPNVTFAAVFRTNNPADGEIMLWAGEPNGNGFGPENEISLSSGNASLGNRIVSSYGGATPVESDFTPFNDAVNFHIAIGTLDNLTNDLATKNANVSLDNVAATTGSGTTGNNYGVYEAATFWGKPDAAGTITRVWNGDMAALVVCAAVLSAAQQTQLFNFWKAKYNL